MTEMQYNESNKAFVSKYINFEYLDDLKKKGKNIRDIFKKKHIKIEASKKVEYLHPET